MAKIIVRNINLTNMNITNVGETNVWKWTHAFEIFGVFLCRLDKIREKNQNSSNSLSTTLGWTQKGGMQAKHWGRFWYLSVVAMIGHWLCRECFSKSIPTNLSSLPPLQTTQVCGEQPTLSIVTICECSQTLGDQRYMFRFPILYI